MHLSDCLPFWALQYRMMRFARSSTGLRAQPLVTNYLLHLQMFSAKRTPMLFKAQLHDVVNDMLGIHAWLRPACRVAC